MRLETKFQDKDFDFGEIVKAKVTTYYDENKVVVMADRARGGISRFEYNSIKDFTDHWEDAPEEPKEYYYIDINSGGIVINKAKDREINEDRASKQIGNYFDTREEAEKAVEKLKAWQRLKDKGFRFDGYDVAHKSNGDLAGQIFYDAGKYSIEDVEKEMDLLFGGEE